ncbi:serine/threonine-protein kinase [Nocardia caishijiensis]|uniref:Serine/threonine protein kinase n=1 Tax=Nocardia caishijiensis TaxID=184756 RepID=A0ABQ6YUI5_9NOCA|nr:serine/threonine-protein kinase [Nocardia caishijiensis]KAF0849465.1 serine/threonine protein kinase [Nocardia caishijiensis]
MQPLNADDPRRIGDYRLLGVLGAGGMGKVYLGRNSGGRTVAVKVIRPDLLGDPELRARFRREVAAARRVGGTFTAPVLDADVDADPPWLATGYVAGISLSDAVAEYGPFPESALLALGHGLAQALVAVHSVGIVHRDLKPSNVLLAVDGPKVIDFGIARAEEDTAFTTTGRVVGSPGFMCPEQITGEPLGPACDVFALGGVLTFAASGHGPFGTTEFVQLLYRIVYAEPTLDAVPLSFRPLVRACLAKYPAARPTPEQVLTELAKIGAPDSAGWLPPPVLHDVSMRAVRLLDLDTDPGVHPMVASPSHRTDPTALAGSTASGRPQATAPPFTPRTTQGGHTPPPGNYASPPRVHPPSPGEAPRRTRTRALLIAAVCVTAVTAAVMASLIGIRIGAQSGTPTVPGTPPTGTETSARPVSSVPDSFLGTWSGQAADGLVTFDIVLTIGPGEVGRELATASNTGQISQSRCERAETLTEATENRLVFRARLTGDTHGDCVDDGNVSTVTRQSDGTLRYSTPGVWGGSIAGTLHKE